MVTCKIPICGWYGLGKYTIYINKHVQEGLIYLFVYSVYKCKNWLSDLCYGWEMDRLPIFGFVCTTLCLCSVKENSIKSKWQKKRSEAPTEIQLDIQGVGTFLIDIIRSRMIKDLWLFNVGSQLITVIV